MMNKICNWNISHWENSNISVFAILTTTITFDLFEDFIEILNEFISRTTLALFKMCLLENFHLLISTNFTWTWTYYWRCSSRMISSPMVICWPCYSTSSFMSFISILDPIHLYRRTSGHTRREKILTRESFLLLASQNLTGVMFRCKSSLASEMTSG